MIKVERRLLKGKTITRAYVSALYALVSNGAQEFTLNDVTQYASSCLPENARTDPSGKDVDPYLHFSHVLRYHAVPAGIVESPTCLYSYTFKEDVGKILERLLRGEPVDVEVNEMQDVKNIKKVAA